MNLDRGRPAHPLEICLEPSAGQCRGQQLFAPRSDGSRDLPLQPHMSTPLNLGEWPPAIRMDTSALINLAEAARRLGCHVETLRIRIRKGRLRAVRGPHGAFYISQDGLLSQFTIPRSNPHVVLTPAKEARSWALVERGLKDGERALLHALRDDPGQNRPLYRLASVHRLVALRLGFDQIAEELGISAGHARRLDRRRLRSALAKARWQEANRGRRLTDARQIVASLRADLEASGFRRHLIVRPRRSGPPEPTTAFTIKRLPAADIQGLRAVGLAEEQIRAIKLVGIGTDELNELLNRPATWAVHGAWPLLDIDRQRPAVKSRPSTAV